MFVRKPKFYIIFLVAILWLNCIADNRWEQYVKNDFDRFKRQMNFQTLLITGGWLSGMYLLSAYDDALNTNVKSLYTENWKTYFNTVDYLGYVPYTLVGSIGITSLTMLGKDKKLQDAAFTSMQAVITSSIFVGAFKIILGRTRPDAGNGPRFFKPFTDINCCGICHGDSLDLLLSPSTHVCPVSLSSQYGNLANGSGPALVY